MLHDRLAVAFIPYAFVAVGLLAYYFAERQGERLKWYWFVIFSSLGGLGFSILFYLWLNDQNMLKGSIQGG